MTYAPRRKITIRTVRAEARTSGQVGKVTIFSSCLTSFRNALTLASQVNGLLSSGSCKSTVDTEHASFWPSGGQLKHKESGVKPLGNYEQLSVGRLRSCLGGRAPAMKGGDERIQRTSASFWMQQQSQTGRRQQGERDGRKGQRDFGKSLRAVRSDDKGQEQR